MKIVFLLIFYVLVFEGCGRKSDPKYQSKIEINSRIIL